MMLPCDICQKHGHAWYVCPDRAKMPLGWKPPRLRLAARGSDLMPQGIKKSTAARKDVQPAHRMKVRVLPQPVPQDRIGGVGDDPEAQPAAGTQAPPVDSMPKAVANVIEKLASDQPVTTAELGEAGDSVLPPLTARGTPRKRAPKGTFDRKAYQAMKARERRAKQKAKS